MKELENLKAESDELVSAINVMKNNEKWLSYWQSALEDMKKLQRENRVVVSQKM